jgi:sigma-B regulation protein RsbU (phosphoserine phosphatase)
LQLSVSEVKIDIVHANGQTIPTIVNGVRRTRHGRVVHDLAVFIARDRDKYERELVSSGKRLREMAARSAELEEVARDRAAFAEQMMAIVSHDLRNPLATVELSATALLGDAADPHLRTSLSRITRATARATRLIHDLLDFTQARMGRGLALAPSDVVLHAVVSESVEELQHAFPERTLQHVMVGTGRCDADPDRLMQLVGNLVTNAITYGRHDSPITITSQVGNGACTIAVHNEGTPIDEAVIPQLFHPMTRGASSPDGSRSIGLGLYIVREIAKSHGGDVSVQSSASAGTIFTAHFPCRRRPEWS